MQFLNFANFYRKFIKYFNKIATLLTKMLNNFAKLNKDDKRKRQRNWSRNHDRDLFNNFFTFEIFHAFKKLRDVFMNVFILRHFDSTLSLRVEIDIFNKVIETILCQQDLDDHWHLIAYHFKKMIFAKCNYETHDKKLLTIIHFFKHWRHYLKSAQHEVLILIDHKNLNRFMIITQLFLKQIRWVQKLSRYNFVIDYRLDAKNSTNDLFKRFDYMIMTSKKAQNHH